MVRHAFEVLTEGAQDAPHLLLRRHGRPAQGADQRAEPGDAGRAPRQAADRRARSVRQVRSFAHHNNARLRDFLDRFGFEYEFMSATECYKAGLFDETLLRMLEVYDKVMDIILPTLGPERRATYSPFLPVSPRTGKVLQVPMVERDAEEGHHRLRRPRDRQEGRDARHRRRASSASGRPTGRCAGPRSASTTRWPART